MLHIVMLGAGFIGRFYAASILGNRNKDRIIGVYSRKLETGKQFAEDFNCEFSQTDLELAVADSRVDMVCVALPNHLHYEAAALCCKYKKGIIMTKPLARNGSEALNILNMVEQAGIFNGYLEDLCYTPKFLKALDSVKKGAIGRVLWAKSRETHPGPHSDWFWDLQKAGGGCMLDLGCHCVEIARGFIGKDIKPIEAMCWADTQVKPIEAEDNAIGLVKYENGAIGQFETSWCFRGGLDLRDEVMGTEGTVWINNFLRTGFEMFSSGQSDNYVAEKTEIKNGWLFPVGDEVNDLGYNHMFKDMFNSYENQSQPQETFYDGYVVHAILDACYVSAKSKKWEPIHLPIWRGLENVKTEKELKSYNEHYWLIKEEVTHFGQTKRVLKHKQTGEFLEQIDK
ncbi:MAG: Gfo/Idh/MocA family oxidoreductase [Alphaproteobacteria bacterium]|nr:Gfo/Idh/MocA family oxidoreductase [Alphaproteobacteria bacterium]